jgi:hypothetical protein
MTMTEKTTTKATDSADTSAGPFPVGTLVKIPHGDRTNYAMVVGYTDPIEEDKAAQIQAAPHGYPLLLDLPGQPREHQAPHEKV